MYYQTHQKVLIFAYSVVSKLVEEGNMKQLTSANKKMNLGNKRQEDHFHGSNLQYGLKRSEVPTMEYCKHI